MEHLITLEIGMRHDNSMHAVTHVFECLQIMLINVQRQDSRYITNEIQ